MKKKDKNIEMASCMLSILDSLKLYDNNSLELGDETLSGMMFRNMKAYNIDLNKELGIKHLRPVIKKESAIMNPEWALSKGFKEHLSSEGYFIYSLSLFKNRNSDWLVMMKVDKYGSGHVWRCGLFPDEYEIVYENTHDVELLIDLLSKGHG